jgi:hypothetical protein
VVSVGFCIVIFFVLLKDLRFPLYVMTGVSSSWVGIGGSRFTELHILGELSHLVTSFLYHYSAYERDGPCLPRTI